MNSLLVASSEVMNMVGLDWFLCVQCTCMYLHFVVDVLMLSGFSSSCYFILYFKETETVCMNYVS